MATTPSTTTRPCKLIISTLVWALEMQLRHFGLGLGTLVLCVGQNLQLPVEVGQKRVFIFQIKSFLPYSAMDKFSSTYLCKGDTWLVSKSHLLSASSCFCCVHASHFWFLLSRAPWCSVCRWSTGWNSGTEGAALPPDWYRDVCISDAQEHCWMVKQQWKMNSS